MRKAKDEVPKTNKIMEISPFFPTSNSCIIDIVRGLSILSENTCPSIKVGMVWGNEIDEKNLHLDNKIKVTENERIKIGSRKFDAYKLEVSTELYKQNESSELPDSESKNARHSKERLIATSYTEYWYAPELRGMVKVVREVYAKDQPSMKQTEELQVFSLNP